MCLCPARAALPTLLFEDQLTPPTAHTCPASPPAAASDSRRADWLLRDYPYSEGVAEHRKGGVCWDCLRFHADESSEQPVSPAFNSHHAFSQSPITPPTGCVYVCVEFVPVSPSEGLTWADDLSSRDLLSLGFITHIELTTFLLSLGVQIKRTHPLRRRRLRRGTHALMRTDTLTHTYTKKPHCLSTLRPVCVCLTACVSVLRQRCVWCPSQVSAGQ